MKNSQRVALNCALCLMIAVLGIYASSFSETVDRIAGNPVYIGYLMSSYAVGSFVSNIFSGPLADRNGKRIVLVISAIILAGGFVLVAFSRFLPLTMIALFIVGAGYGPSEAIGLAVISDENEKKASFWTNISQILFCVTATVAPVIAIRYYLAGGTYTGVFTFCAVLVLLLAIYYAFAKFGAAPARETRAPADKNIFTIFKKREFLVYFIMIFLYVGYEILAPAYGKQMILLRGGTDEFAAYSIAGFWVAMIIGRIAGAFMGGREKIAFRLFPPFTLLGAIILILSPTGAVAGIGLFLYGLGCGPLFSVLFVLAANSQKERSGTACAVMMVSASIAMTAFPSVIGSMLDNPAHTFIGCFITCTLLIGCIFFIKPAKNYDLLRER